MALKMNEILQELKLNHLIQNFEEEHIDIDVYMSLTDEQLRRLGVNTIGERARLHHRVRSELQSRTNGTTDKTTRQTEEDENTPSNSVVNLVKHRNLLFGRGKKSSKASHKRKFGGDSDASDGQAQHKKKNKSKSKTWTITVVCLAEKDAKCVPTPLEKEKLFGAGLGPKKIQFCSEDTEADVLHKIAGSDSPESDTLATDSMGFPQLQNCGGFELLQCRQNSRTLTLIECDWSVKSLKTFMGYQAKLYIRPIQKNLSTEKISKNISGSNSEKMKCQNCLQTFSIRELRSHIESCMCNQIIENDTDGEELPDPGLNSPVAIDSEKSTTNDHNNIIVHDAIIYVHDVAPQSSFIKNETDEACVIVDPTPSTSACEGSCLGIEGNSSQNTNSVIVEKTPQINCLLKVEEDKLEMNQDILHINSDTASIYTYEKEGTSVSIPETDEKHSPILKAIQDCINQDITDPVEILRFLQSEIVKGRRLEAGNRQGNVCCGEEITCSTSDDTNFIIVDRNDILVTSFDEICTIKDEDLTKTLEVQFYGEAAVDQGGPRKEFFRLALNEIQKKYFEKGFRDYMSSDYVAVGKIMALSILQNGKLPRFMTEEMLNDIFLDVEPKCPCLKNLRCGLDKLGLVQVGILLPMFKYLFRPSQITLTNRSLIRILEPEFSENGTNDRLFENKVYSAFLRYLREVASGRRGTLSLQHVLQFTTGASEEPVLGFEPKPSIKFVLVRDDLTFIPTANTCGNELLLPRPSFATELPQDGRLFSFYDYAFMNEYYGLI